MDTKLQPKTHYIEQWRDLRQLSRQQLGSLVGMTRQNVQKIEQFDRPLTQAQAPRFAKSLGIEVWQLYLPPDQAAVVKGAIKGKNKGGGNPGADVEFLKGLSKIEQIDIRAGLGGGGEVDSENTMIGGYQVSKDAVTAVWGVPDDYLRSLGVSPNGLFLFTVIGDSMTRNDGSGILSGDLMLANTNDRRPSPPGIFAIWDGLGTVVKRVEYMMNSDPPMVSVISDNPTHARREFSADEVNIIGRCVWFGRGL